jgi:hypothetical protein
MALGHQMTDSLVSHILMYVRNTPTPLVAIRPFVKDKSLAGNAKPMAANCLASTHDAQTAVLMMYTVYPCGTRDGPLSLPRW